MKKKITLDRPSIYRIQVQGQLDQRRAEQLGMSISAEVDGPPTTTLIGEVDQAALHGLLRRLYALGLPLVSVQCVEVW